MSFRLSTIQSALAGYIAAAAALAGNKLAGVTVIQEETDTALKDGVDSALESPGICIAIRWPFIPSATLTGTAVDATIQCDVSLLHNPTTCGTVNPLEVMEALLAALAGQPSGNGLRNLSFTGGTMGELTEHPGCYAQSITISTPTRIN